MNIPTMDFSSLKVLKTGVQKVVDQPRGKAEDMLTSEEGAAFDRLLQLVASSLASPSPSNADASNDSTPPPPTPLSLEQKVDSILSLLRPTSSSTATRQLHQFRGIGPNGEEVSGQDLIREGGEGGREGDVEQARRWGGHAVDPSPEPEGTTRLRKMVIRIQTQNSTTHAMIAASLLFSMVWRLGTFAFVNSISSNITRPFDFAGNFFNKVLKRGRGQEGIPIDLPLHDLRVTLPGVKKGTEAE